MYIQVRRTQTFYLFNFNFCLKKSAMTLLLHICCAPCAIFPIEALRKERNDIAGFFYNPNIHPYSEYLKRKAEVEKYALSAGLKTTYPDYDIKEYFRRVSFNEEPDKRCVICWSLRAQKTAQAARDNGFDAFTTTLLGSPYQNQEAVRKVCEEAADKAGVKFHYEDFRIGFRQAHRKAHESGIYCQNYCGCIFSEKERAEKI